MRVRYGGPDGAINHDVGRATGSTALTPGADYDVPADLAARLIASSVHWSASPPEKPAKQTVKPDTTAKEPSDGTF